MNKVVAIIQARMGSTRLPGKVLKEILGRPLLSYMIERLKGARRIQEIVIATPEGDPDRPIRELAESLGVGSFAGSEEDVLDRYYQAARRFEADPIVRLTADCPLIDPALVDRIIGRYLENQGQLDHLALSGRFPDGLDTELFSFAALERAWWEAKRPSEREHVTPYIWKNPHLFRLGTIDPEEDLSGMRWTVDDERDLRLVTEIFRGLYRPGEIFGMADILRFLRENPALLEINRGTIRNEGYLKSLREEGDL